MSTTIQNNPRNTAARKQRPAREPALSITRRTRKSRAPRQAPITLPAEGFVRQRTVLAVFGIAKTTMWRWIGCGRFPAPKKLGPAGTHGGVIGWDVADLREHIDRVRNGAA